MTAFLDRIAFWRREPVPAERPDYLADFGPNVPVEDLGGKPVYYENNQPVYPGREKAP